MRRLVFILLFCAVSASASPCAGNSRGYAYSISHGHVVFSGAVSFEAFARTKDKLGDDFFWVRIDKKSYVVRDEDFLNRIRALFAPVRALAPEQDRIGHEEAALDRELDALEDGPEEKRDEKRMDELRVKLDAVHKRERAIDKREEDLECEAEKKMWPLVNEAIKSGLAVRM